MKGEGKFTLCLRTTPWIRIGDKAIKLHAFSTSILDQGWTKYASEKFRPVRNDV